MAGKSETRVLPRPHPSEAHRISSTQPSQRKAKSLQHHQRSRSPPTRPLPSSQRRRFSARAPALASSSHRIQDGDDDSANQLDSTEEEETIEEEDNTEETFHVVWNKMASDVMRYMLFKNYQKPNVPVRRADLLRMLRERYKESGSTGTAIYLARQQIEEKFGLQMKGLHWRRRSAQDWAFSCEYSYVLESTLPKGLLEKHVLSPTMASNLGFVLLVIGVIMTSGCTKVNEEILLKKLHDVGIKDGNPVFGDVKDALETAVKQRYIQKEKLKDGAGYSFELAERSLEPSFNTRLKTFLSQVVR